MILHLVFIDVESKIVLFFHYLISRSYQQVSVLLQWAFFCSDTWCSCEVNNFRRWSCYPFIFLNGAENHALNCWRSLLRNWKRRVHVISAGLPLVDVDILRWITRMIVQFLHQPKSQLQFHRPLHLGCLAFTIATLLLLLNILPIRLDMQRG